MSRALPKHLDVPWGVSDGLWFALGWIGLPILVLLALAQIAPMAPPIHSFIVAFRQDAVWASFVFVLFDALLATVLLGYYLRKYHASWRDLGLRRFKLGRALLYLLAAFFIFGFAVWGVETVAKLLIPSFDVNQPQVNEFTRSISQHPWLSFLALVVIPPLVEESVFRGFLFPAFAKKWGPVVGALVVSILFGLAHWQGNVTLYTLVLSLVLCMMYYKLGSLWPGIALHMLNNLLAFWALTAK